MQFLIKRFIRGDKEAFVELMELNKQNMYKVARSYLRSEEDIADVLQETILSCFENLHSLKETKYFKTWMIRILINKCNDRLKDNQQMCLMEQFPEVIDPCKYEQNIEFEELMNSVDEKYRTILTLYYVEGFTIKEIAQILDIAEGTVKTRLVRGRRKIAVEYEHQPIMEGRQ